MPRGALATPFKSYNSDAAAEEGHCGAIEQSRSVVQRNDREGGKAIFNILFEVAKCQRRILTWQTLFSHSHHTSSLYRFIQ